MQREEGLGLEVKRFAREAAEAIGFPELAEEIELNLRRMLVLGLVQKPSRSSAAAATFLALKKRFGRASAPNIARFLGLSCNGGGTPHFVRQLASRLESLLNGGEPEPSREEPREKEDFDCEVEVLTNEDKERIVLETLLEEGPMRSLKAIVAAVKKRHNLGEHSVQRAVKRLLEKGLIARTDEGYVPLTLDLEARTAVRT